MTHEFPCAEPRAREQPALQHGQPQGVNGPSRMTQFWGTQENKRDSKGRVSIPASFRAALKNGVEGEQIVSMVLRASHKFACVDAWPVSAFEQIAGPLDLLDLFSDDQDDLATTIYADAVRVESDKEGRILLPDSLARHAGLDDQGNFCAHRTGEVPTALAGGQPQRFTARK